MVIESGAAASGAVPTRGRWWVRALRGVGWLAGIALAAWGVVAALVVAQGATNEVRHADAILVLPGNCASPPSQRAPPCGTAPLDYALDLYRRGYASHLLLIGGQAVAPERAYLLAKGFPEQALVAEEAGVTRWGQLHEADSRLRERGLSSLLVVGEPPQILVTLKMARDLGLAAHGAPLPGFPAFVPQAVARESLAYWRYVLFGG